MNLNLPVSVIMHPNPVSVKGDQKLVDIKHIYEKKNFHRHIPVVCDGAPAGMISLIDFMRIAEGASLDDRHEQYQRLTAADIMTNHVVAKDADTPIREIAEIFVRNEIHAIPIVKHGQLAGIVTATDVIRYLLEAVKNIHLNK